MKRFVTAALRYIKTYNGPSSTWFSYQDSLSEGCSRLASIISELPVSEQTARLLVSLLLRLDEKISRGGIDGSDGTVGECMEETVLVLQEYTRLDSSCVKAFDILKDKKTCFGREEPLLKMRKSG